LKTGGREKKCRARDGDGPEAHDDASARATSERWTRIRNVLYTRDTTECEKRKERRPHDDDDATTTAAAATSDDEDTATKPP